MAIWEAAADNDPQLVAEALRVDAQDAALDVLRRQRRPALEFVGEGDIGQRARPGEEREEDFSSRGFLLARVEWALLESGRALERRAAILQRETNLEAATAASEALQAELARMYIGASIARERLSLLSSVGESFDRIKTAADARREAGVDSGGASERIAQELAHFQNQWQEARLDSEARLLQLAMMANQENVSPHTIAVTNVPSDMQTGNAQPAALTRLERDADRLRVSAEHLARADGWRLDAIGQTGPYVSAAYDDYVEDEYFVGLRVTWRPDIAGVRQQKASAEQYRAEAMEQDAAALQRDYRLRQQDAMQRLHDVSGQARDWAESLERARESLRVAEARWEQGVGSWKAYWDEQEEMLSISLAELAWREKMATLLVDYAEMGAMLHELPQWIE